ncbi:hypothetical protein B4144_2243 [Bacillus atrophaeus]|nr:hypothetical protein B4144_2243 [Bacillus atrophaeus]
MCGLVRTPALLSMIIPYLILQKKRKKKKLTAIICFTNIKGA